MNEKLPSRMSTFLIFWSIVLDLWDATSFYAALQVSETKESMLLFHLQQSANNAEDTKPEQ